MKKREKRFILAKETVRNLTAPTLDRDMAAIRGGTAGGPPSKGNSIPCCEALLPAAVPQGQGPAQGKSQVQRKPRGQRR